MYIVSLVETMIYQVLEDPPKYKRTEDTIVQATVIFDMEQFSMRHITYKPGKSFPSHQNFTKKLKNIENDQNFRSAMDSAIRLIQIYEANYPEMLRRVFVINGTCSKNKDRDLTASNYKLYNPSK